MIRASSSGVASSVPGLAASTTRSGSSAARARGLVRGRASRRARRSAGRESARSPGSAGGSGARRCSCSGSMSSVFDQQHLDAGQDQEAAEDVDDPGELAGSAARRRAIMAPRISSAPTMPQNSTRCWYMAGTAKKPKIMAMTKMLSTASDFSTR